MIFLAVAFASVPAALRPVAAPIDIEASFKTAKPSSTGPVCTELLPGHAQLCFRSLEQRKLRWIDARDVSKWSTDVAALRLSALERGRPLVLEAIERQNVAGMKPDASSGYVLIRDGEGWAVSALLDPSSLAETLGGGRFRVAIPRAGVLFAWPDPTVTKISPRAAAELDHILAVAVRESYEAANDAVSPMVHAWNGKAFEPFGQAKAKEPDSKRP